MTMTAPDAAPTPLESMSLPQAALLAVCGVTIAAIVVRVLCNRLLPRPAPRPERDLTSAAVVAAIAFGAALLAIMTIAGLLADGGERAADAPVRLIDLALPSIANLGAAIVGLNYARTRLRTDATTFGLTRARPRDLAFALGVLLALVPAYFGIGVLNLQLIDALGLERHQRLVNALLTNGRLDPWAALMIVGVVPFCEELLFRGVVQTALMSVARPWVAIAASAALFALVHDPQSWALIGAVGVGLGIVRDRTGSVLASTFFHATFNAVMLSQIALEAAGAR